VHWRDLEEQQPRLAAVGRQRLVEPGVLLVVTLRRDGTPRLSPVEPWLMDGDLWLSMMWESHKARDLQRDPRILVHSIVTARDGQEGEFKVRGRAQTEERLAVQERYAADVSEHIGWTPTPGQFHLFRVDIDHVAFLRYVEATGDQYVASWPPAKEHMRPGDTATSLGDAVPVTDLLDSG
jgi:pyridoxamine 5'-phosphate oxidase-like protein